MDAETSPFLAVPREQHVARNALCFALRDAHPVSPGHSLVIPHRPVVTWFEATREDPVGGVRHAVVGRGRYEVG